MQRQRALTVRFSEEEYLLLASLRHDVIGADRGMCGTIRRLIREEAVRQGVLPPPPPPPPETEQAK